VVHANQTDARAGHPPRVGFVVSKAVGSAVVRNRTKRRLRGLAHQRLGLLPAGTDVVIRANPPAAQANSAELGAEMDGALSRVLRRLGAASDAGSGAGSSVGAGGAA
jgi:ribonuclease P protein component